MSNSFNARDVLNVNGQDYEYFRLDAVKGSAQLPFSMKVSSQGQMNYHEIHMHPHPQNIE